MSRLIYQYFFYYLYLFFIFFSPNILIIPTYEFFNFPFLKYADPLLHLNSFANIIIKDDNKFYNKSINIILFLIGIIFLIFYFFSLFYNSFVTYKDIMECCLVSILMIYYISIIFCYFFSYLICKKYLNIRNKNNLIFHSSFNNNENKNEGYIEIPQISKKGKVNLKSTTKIYITLKKKNQI